MSHVFLIGFMGAGKSAVGQLLASRLSRPFVDLDSRVEEAAGRAIADIFAAEGEAAFRSLEREALASLAVAPPSVVACGGGVVLDECNRAELRRLGTVVWLRVSARRALARAGRVSGRPLLDGRGADDVAALMSVREPMYLDAADLEFDTDEMDADEVAAAVVVALGAVPA